jgi:hypothetical protein
MNWKRCVTITGFALFAAVAPLSAHHSVAATFDIDRIVALRGVVGEVRWLNPHATFSLEVADNAAGAPAIWDVELPSPIALLRRGFKRDDLKPGSNITIEVWVAKDGSHRAAGARTLTLEDGRTISANSMWGPVAPVVPTFRQP